MLSAAVGAPLPPRAATMLSSIGRVYWSGRITSWLSITTVKPPRARTESAARLAAARSCLVSPWRGGASRSLKIRGELTIAACSGCATGTLMTSIRNSAEFGSSDGSESVHPASSLDERTREVPEM